MYFGVMYTDKSKKFDRQQESNILCSLKIWLSGEADSSKMVTWRSQLKMTASKKFMQKGVTFPNCGSGGCSSTSGIKNVVTQRHSLRMPAPYYSCFPRDIPSTCREHP
jgi:hypothetical protein